MTVVEEIQQQLRILERDRRIKILLAVESGSRAWGFPSPDSDYDVRIIYLQDKVSYLSINERKDQIDYFHGKLLDISGWDIRKTLRLLSKSNATPFEWNQSPIVYQAAAGFQAQLQALAIDYFQPRHSLHHYKGIAHNAMQGLAADGKIRLKKLFYVIRPLLAAHWIIHRKQLPPMDIFSLLAGLDDDAITSRIEQLIIKKASVNEAYLHQPSNEILAFIQAQFEQIESKEHFERSKRKDLEPLNIFFRSLLAV